MTVMSVSAPARVLYAAEPPQSAVARAIPGRLIAFRTRSREWHAGKTFRWPAPPVTARVGIGPIGDGRFGLTVQLQVHAPSISDRAVLEALVAGAHEVCPYSNATRGNIPVELTVV